MPEVGYFGSFSPSFRFWGTFLGILGLAEHLGMEYGNENCRGHSEHAKEVIFRVSFKKIELVYAFRAEKRPKTAKNGKFHVNPAGWF